MKKLFISQPMKEKTNEEIRKEREDAVFCAKELMGDVAYFASGWKNARGCKIEHICAEQYGINIVEA